MSESKSTCQILIIALKWPILYLDSEIDFWRENQNSFRLLNIQIKLPVFLAQTLNHPYCFQATSLMFSEVGLKYRNFPIGIKVAPTLAHSECASSKFVALQSDLKSAKLFTSLLIFAYATLCFKNKSRSIRWPYQFLYLT